MLSNIINPVEALIDFQYPQKCRARKINYLKNISTLFIVRSLLKMHE